jgi:uncharacterized protein YqgC (DUF456 family)
MPLSLRNHTLHVRSARNKSNGQADAENRSLASCKPRLHFHHLIVWPCFDSLSNTAPPTRFFVLPLSGIKHSVHLMPNWPLETWIALVGTPFIAMLGIVLTLVTLPGTWLIVLWSLALAIWQPTLVPWWVVVILIILAATGEALEFLASAVGAAKAGASKWGIIFALLGAFLGALIGMFIVPVIGAIVGGALGAAAGAVGGEMALAKRTWDDSKKIALGAAIGRLLSMLAKGLVAVVMGMLLCLLIAFRAM